MDGDDLSKTSTTINGHDSHEARLPNAEPGTLALHADDRLNVVDDVAPPIHVSTTFRYPKDPNHLMPQSDGEDINVREKRTLEISTLLQNETLIPVDFFSFLVRLNTSTPAIPPRPVHASKPS